MPSIARQLIVFFCCLGPPLPAYFRAGRTSDRHLCAVFKTPVRLILSDLGSSCPEKETLAQLPKEANRLAGKGRAPSALLLAPFGLALPTPAKCAAERLPAIIQRPSQLFQPISPIAARANGMAISQNATVFHHLTMPAILSAEKPGSLCELHRLVIAHHFRGTRIAPLLDLGKAAPATIMGLLGLVLFYGVDRWGCARAGGAPGR